MYVFRIAHKQVMSGRFNFLILVLKDVIDVATLPAELRLYLSKICSSNLSKIYNSNSQVF